MIAKTVGIEKEYIRQILCNDLNMQKVLKILISEQKEAYKNACIDTLGAIKITQTF